MSKVYTKTGDSGTTSLIGGERVSKADLRVEAYGTVDELAAQLALFGDIIAENKQLAATEFYAQITDIQGYLMIVEAILATGKGGESKSPTLPANAVGRLENQIEEMSKNLPPITGFTIPGGHKILSQSHVCRTVCRRAERAVVGIPDTQPVPEAYLNRLSDWLYVSGRKAVEILKIKETYWAP
jgi:cob(I)alamin adenosyltransferase